MRSDKRPLIIYHLSLWALIVWALIVLHTLAPPLAHASPNTHCDVVTKTHQDTQWDYQWRPTPLPSFDLETFSTKASEQMALCGGSYQSPTLFSPELTENDPETIHGWANSYFYAKGIANLCGEVMLRKDKLQIQSHHVLINQGEQTADFTGQVTLTTEDAVLRGDSAKLFLDRDLTQLNDAHFFLYPQRARGDAKKITIQGSETTTIHSGQYTTCPPENNDWFIEGQRISLNHTEGWGTLKHMRLKVSEVPLLYLPYFKFPLDDRRHTGFLFPEFNSLSDPDIALPFYWNIAPNYDLLFSPRYIGGRGLMSEAEFRYLHQPGEGALEIGFLPEDSQFENQDRKSARWRHEGTLGQYWQWFSDVGYLSDNDYLNDLGSQLSTIGQSYVNRELALQGNSGAWAGRLQLQSYQSIDSAILPENLPYRKLPQVGINHTTSLFDYLIELNNDLEYTYWAQPQALNTPYAHRSHWQTQLSLPFRDSWYFLTPIATLHSSYYQLLGETGSAEKRSLPSASIDGGLFFDRPIRFKNEQWTQSLEPRLFHTYTPFRHQDALPVFDTTELTFGFDQLFRSNRFSGIDRIGDTHQSTLALTSRLFNPVRHEKANLTLGQIFYHKDRLVTLPDEEPLTRSRSATVFRGTLNLSQDFLFSSGISWDDQQNIIEDGNVSLINTPPGDFTWRAQYRYRQADTTEERLEQVNFAFRKRLKGFWHILSAVHYDVENEQILEQLSGFQYEDCCWRTDLVYHRRIRSSTEVIEQTENNYSFLLQFELKGLGGIGSRLNKLLENQIPGIN